LGERIPVRYLKPRKTPKKARNFRRLDDEKEAGEAGRGEKGEKTENKDRCSLKKNAPNTAKPRSTVWVPCFPLETSPHSRSDEGGWGSLRSFRGTLRLFRGAIDS